MEMMQTVRGFINLIKANPTTRDHYKTNKLANCKYDSEVNESEIKTSNLDQIQQIFNINNRQFYQTFIVCEHLKRPIILGRDFSIQNCIGISWTKSNTRQLTQNNEVIAETSEYQSPAIASVSLKRNIKVPP